MAILDIDEFEDIEDADIESLWEDFDWAEKEIMDSEDRIKKGVPIGSDIQRALRDECLKVSPYVRVEVGTKTRFDVVMYLPKGMEFLADMPESSHCWHKFRRIYCKKKWNEVKDKYKISKEERKQRMEEDREKHKDDPHYYGCNIPSYRYNGKEYDYAEDFWKSNAKKELAICDQANCQWFKDKLEREKKNREQYGFMAGLHIFEVKSDKDKHDLLIHQIPNMVAIADYVWLVLGKNQPIPEWLPPYVSVLRLKRKKFKIEHHHKIEITQPPMYRHTFGVQGYKIENSEEYAFVRLMRKWRINSMFHFMFEGNMIIDMQDDIEKLLSFLRRADKNKTKQDYKRFQRNLFNYIEHNGDEEGSGKDVKE